MSTKTRTKVVSFDLDSTICNTEHRWHMIDRSKQLGPEFWNEYSLACVNDTPGPALPLAQFMTENGDPIIIVSGRSEIARGATQKWLAEHDVHPWAMFLCDDRHDYMPHGEWKATRLKEIAEANNWDIVMHFDDISAVAQAVEDDPELDIPVILVHTIGAVPDHLG